MSAAMDVAYLDAPWVEHVERLELMMRVSPDCWADDCHDCRIPGCICACHDEPPARPARAAPQPRRCRTCGYLVRSPGHKVACAGHERLMRLADSIGAPR